MGDRVKELNASDERGIDIVRNQVKNFAMRKIGRISGKSEYPCPPYKIIVLDEADAMTQSAQAALRRIMEDFSKTTRFCLICNYVSRIINPITSRTTKYRFGPLPHDAIVFFPFTRQKNRLKLIAKTEGITSVSEEAFDRLIDVSNGDLRKSITYLQTCNTIRTAGDMELEDEVTLKAKDIDSVAGVVPIEKIMYHLWFIVSDFFNISRNTALPFQDLLNSSNALLFEGFPVDKILDGISQILEHSLTKTDLYEAEEDLEYAPSRERKLARNGVKLISTYHKGIIGIEISRIDKALGDGSSEALELIRLACFIRVFLFLSDSENIIAS